MMLGRKSAVRLLALIAATALAGCTSAPVFDGDIESFLRASDPQLRAVLDAPARYRLQILYSTIERSPNATPRVQIYAYRENAENYFYPASTVKMPVAALALEKVNALRELGVRRDTTLLTDAAAPFQTRAARTATGARPSVAQYVCESLGVSDNNAFNRLYEFVGQRAINEMLRARGYSGSRIVHRLGTPLTPAQNAWTNPVRFVEGATTLHVQSDVRDTPDFVRQTPLLLGAAHVAGGVLYERPRDFAANSAIPLRELHDMLLALVLPEAVPTTRRFDLGAQDLALLRRCLSAYPRELGFGVDASGQPLPDGYVKFLLYGGDEPRIPGHVRITNKVGDAYGFLTDVAYIQDTEAGIEFVLAATLYVNDNATFNDDQYEYDSVGLPFLRALGQAFYRHQVQKSRDTPQSAAAADALVGSD